MGTRRESGNELEASVVKCTVVVRSLSDRHVKRSDAMMAGRNDRGKQPAHDTCESMRAFDDPVVNPGIETNPGMRK